MKKIILSAILLLAFCPLPGRGVKKSVQESGLRYIESSVATFDAMQKQLHSFAEPGYQEYRSAALLSSYLEEQGFTVERGVADIPTAFVATFGSGSPVIGVMAEYDALPGLSQDTVTVRKPIEGKPYGHGCGHNIIGTASVAGGVSIARFLKESGVSGTVKVFGCPAEEGGGGKAYMTTAGLFDGCDVVFDWHPASKNTVGLSTGLANIGIKFTFKGTAAHAAAAPWKGRSALDGVESFNYMMNMMREHLPEGTLVHYVITDGGTAPNIVPEHAQVYYYIRHPRGSELLEIIPRVLDAARGAALGTGTEAEWEIMHGNYERLINTELAKLFLENLMKVGGLELDGREKAFIEDIGGDVSKFTSVVPELGPAGHGGGSSDAGNVSQVVPLAKLEVCTTSAGIHTWQQSAIGGTTIGTKAVVNVAKVYYLTALQIYTDPARLKAIKDEFTAERGQSPAFIPLTGDRKPPLDYRN